MIEKFSTLRAVAVPLDRDSVDTDAILPARFLKTIKRTGLGKNLFHAWRYDEGGKEVPDFPFNMPPYRGGKILVTGENFGCGSSREHAVWALMDYGVRVVIAPSFGDIFANNGLKNGLLPVRLPSNAVRTLIDRLQGSPGSMITVDLPAQTVTGPDSAVHPFDIGSFPKECLLKGQDEIALTLQHEDDISWYERDRKNKTPWLFLDL
ncbi:MAG TPA: 3-isopropylmalate dehydratase small subunit [Candidatus Deferrimicrobiaceae bacterium]|jgi:3-isopropylmalate/(R)-2-methylmalate dehydratase small subunit|nr:3-isopropylmalate dehydratase small subunit [Candidatus Deferrimicrobiaceae bacterium]